MSVVVTSASNRIAYTIVNSLGSKGIPVITCDFVRFAMSFASRYSKDYFVYPSPYTRQMEFIEALTDKLMSYKCEVLLPVHEETFLISKYQKEISKITKIIVPEYNKILTAHNKDKWTNIALKLNIPVPKSYDIKNIKKNIQDINDIKFPILIKPKQGGGAWGILEVKKKEQLISILNQHDFFARPWNRFFIQEKIIGHVQCVAMLFRYGEFRAKVAYKQLRDYPFSGGQATLRISNKHELAEKYLKEMLSELQWHGVCQADFIIDKNTNIPYMIDINPRFWGSLVQGIASGIDFPYLMYKMALEGDVKPIHGFKTGVVTRWIGGDIRTFYGYIRSSKNKKRGIYEYIFPRMGKITYDDFKLKDPLPFFVWFADVALRAIRNRTIRAISHETLKGIWK